MESDRNNALTIDAEIADRITVANLKDYRESLQKELDAFHEGKYLHPEDVVGNYRRIEALTMIIRDFGNEY